MNLVANVEFMKMSTPQEKAQFVSWFIETKSDIQAQRNFRRKYGRKPTARPTIRTWHKKFMETVSMLHRKRAGRPQISEEIESVRVAYTRSPRKPIRGASTQLQIPHSTIHKVLHRNLRYFMHMKCSYCKPLNQKVSRDEKNLQR